MRKRGEQFAKKEKKRKYSYATTRLRLIRQSERNGLEKEYIRIKMEQCNQDKVEMLLSFHFLD